MFKAIVITIIVIFTINVTAASITIKKGDTVSAIAKAACCSIAEIKKLNPGLDVNKIKIGQSLTIPDLDMDRLFSAFVYVESKGNDNAIGDGGKAVGCLQMWKIMVDECNRFCHTTFTYEDRTDRSKCKEMFIGIMNAKNVKTVTDAVKVWNPKSNGKAYREAYSNNK